MGRAFGGRECDSSERQEKVFEGLEEGRGKAKDNKEECLQEGAGSSKRVEKGVLLFYAVKSQQIRRERQEEKKRDLLQGIQGER